MDLELSPMNAYEFGQRFKAARESKAISQTDLGEKIGCSGATISQWEGGYAKSVSAELLQRACDELGTTVPWMLFGRGTEAPSPIAEIADAWWSLTSDQRKAIAEQAVATAAANRRVIEELKGKK
jgi:transcriptional regulator with XRE-family HTH domain